MGAKRSIDPPKKPTKKRGMIHWARVSSHDVEMETMTTGGECVSDKNYDDRTLNLLKQ
jgi:hypothetical protein